MYYARIGQPPLGPLLRTPLSNALAANYAYVPMVTRPDTRPPRAVVETPPNFAGSSGLIVVAHPTDNREIGQLANGDVVYVLGPEIVGPRALRFRFVSVEKTGLRGYVVARYVTTQNLWRIDNKSWP